MAVFSNAEALARIKASVYDPKDPLWRQYYRHGLTMNGMILILLKNSILERYRLIQFQDIRS